MTNFSYSNYLNKVWIIGLVAFMVSCSQFEAPAPDNVNLENAEELASAFSMTPFGLGMENARTASAPVSAGEITPDIIPGANPGGNRTCAEVATAYSFDATDESPGRTVSFTNSFNQIDYNDDPSKHDGVLGFLPGGGNTATFGAITATTDGTFVSWSIDVPEGYCVKYLAAIVKGSNDANVYFYDGDVRSDSGLASPTNQGNQQADLSNLSFCYTLERCDDDPCFEWKGETATGDGTRFANSSTWFMWNNYRTSPIALIAGQDMTAGSIQMGAVSGGNITITITLDNNWRFKTVNNEIVSDAVKVLAYPGTTPPTSFTGFGNDVRNIRFLRANFNGNTATITVPAHNFYFIHVDVEQKRDVPCED